MFCGISLLCFVVFHCYVLWHFIVMFCGISLLCFVAFNRVWAPQIFWDPDYRWENGEKGGYMIYYSMLNRAEEQYDRMYYSYADKSFTKITTPKLLFDWGYATIDADINYLKSDGLYHMLIKKEGGKPGIYTATSKNLRNFHDPVDIEGVTGPQHGSFMRITKKEYNKLLKWDKELKAAKE